MQFALERAQFTGADDKAAFLRRHLDSVPPTEKDRLRRIASHGFHRADDSHPPTYHRIKLLDARAADRPQLELSAEDAESIRFAVLGGADETYNWLLQRRRRRH